MAATLLVVQPDPGGPLDRFEDWLTEAGLALRIVRPFAGDELPLDLEDADGLLVLGGDMSSLDDEAHPWLADVRRLFQVAGAQARPALGICLGAQILARAAGGTVAVGDHGLEAGVAEVRLRPEAADDALLSGLPSTFPAATMHGDAVSVLSADGAWLAEGTPYAVQAFRVGPCAWGVQFHPEVSPAGYAGWVDDLDDPDGPAYLDAVEAADPEVAPAARALAHTFARLVIGA